MMQIRTDSYNPDVLTCIANLSSDEVFTPPQLVNRMLDLLPAELWSDADATFLDPGCKSGVFLREIAKRLDAGLEGQIPDRQERVNHIFRNQLFGLSITELTTLLSRRSVYCSKTANGKYSVCETFDTPEGNIRFERIEHTWENGRCVFCGANEANYERGEELETHAYEFIHTEHPEEIFKMKFDVIIGNPPYQLSDGGGGGGASATPIYNLFVEAALSLQPHYVVMITPSRWFSGGKGLDNFRDRMLHDHRFVKLVDFPQLYDVFPGVKIRGGISYWLWSRDHDGPCEVVTVIGNKVIGDAALRKLDAYDVLVRRNEAVRILDKVASYRVNGQPEPSLGDYVSARKPFGLTNQRGKATPAGMKDPVLVYGNQHTSYLERSAITSNLGWVDNWKVLLVKAHGTSGRDDVTILGEPVVAGPGTACTETYLVIDRCNSEVEAQHLAAYMGTRFVRFLVSLRKITQNITRDSYKFVPRLQLNRLWTDKALYKRYGLTAEEIAFIESMVRPMEASDE